MKLEQWVSHEETAYSLILDEDQLNALVLGYVPKLVQAMAEDVLFWRAKDLVSAELPEAVKKPKRKKRKGTE